MSHKEINAQTKKNHLQTLSSLVIIMSVRDEGLWCRGCTQVRGT